MFCCHYCSGSTCLKIDTAWQNNIIVKRINEIMCLLMGHFDYSNEQQFKTSYSMYSIFAMSLNCGIPVGVTFIAWL